MISSPSPALPPAPGPPPNPPTYGSSFQQNAGARINAGNQGSSGFGGTILGGGNSPNLGSPGLTPGTVGAVASSPSTSMGSQKTLLGQ